MPKRFLIAANWKMHSPPEGWDTPDSPYRPIPEADIVIFPSFIDLRICVGAGLTVGAQCGQAEASGARTGDVSMAMVKDARCVYVLCGHSERRRNHGETDAEVTAQVEAALALGLIPILCVGETKKEKELERGREAVLRQLAAFRPGAVIAYEPVWAISGGDPTKPAAAASDAQDMHAYIRLQLPEEARESTRIIYGGSANGKNAASFLQQPHIDGLLPGGASLKPDEFRKIVEAAKAGA